MIPIPAELIDRGSPYKKGTPVRIIQFSSSCNTAIIARDDGLLDTAAVTSLRLAGEVHSNGIANVIRENMRDHGVMDDRKPKSESTSWIKRVMLAFVNFFLFTIDEEETKEKA